MGSKVKDLELAMKIAEEGAKTARAEKKALRMSEALDPHVGKRLYITQADRMALDPSKGYLGGSGFPDLATMLPEYKGMSWAVNTPGIAKTMVKSMERNPEEAIWTNLQGSPEQHRSNRVVFDKIMKQFTDAVMEDKLTPELHAKINKKLASIKIGKTDIPMFPEDIDILSPEFMQHAEAFHKRSAIADVLSGKGVGGQKGKIIPYEDIIAETTDPALADVKTGSIGNRLFSLSGEIHPERGDLHPAYPTALGGERLSEAFTPAPKEIVLKEFIDQFKAVPKNKGREPTYYDLTRGYAPSVKITDQMLEDLYSAGHKKGGKISLGKRLDKTEKEKGFLGEIPTPRGDFMTEMSVGAPNTDELFRPSIVSDVHPAELNYMIQTGKVPTDLYPISQRHAEKRIAEGKSPFWNEKEDVYAGGGPIKGLEKAIRVGEEAAKQTLKKAKDYKPTKGKISELKDYIKDYKGEYGAQRVERAADLVPNLENQYSLQGLMSAFDGDNAKSLMVMHPKDFEKYARELPSTYGKSIDAIKFEGGKQVPITIPPEESYYNILTGKDPYELSDYTDKKMKLDDYLDYLGKTARGSGLLETPYLILDESLNLPNYRIVGHEGRHRSRALSKLGDESTLVRLLPRRMREGLPRRSQEEFQQGLSELLGPNPKVYPEAAYGEKESSRGLIELPEFFAKGGHTQGKPIQYEEEYPRSTKSDAELLDEFKKDELSVKDYLKATPTIAKTAGKMLKEQAKEELPTYLEPRAIPDVALNALATGLGSISDLAHIGTGVERPVLGSEQLMDLLNEYGLTSGVKRPLAENLLTIASPKVLRTAEKGLNKLAPAIERSFTPVTTTVEAVAPDLAKARPRDFQEYVTNRLISDQYGGTPMNIMGDRITSKLPAQGVYFNEAGELETNPMMAIDIPNIRDVSKAKELRADIASAGEALNQESMAGIRFLPLATNKIEDATAILVKPKSGKISNEDVIKLGNEFGNSMVVSHNPRLGGVILAPFDKPAGELEMAQSMIKDLFGSDMRVKAGHSDLTKDRFYMPRSEYAKEGARKVPKSTKAVRQELKEAEALRYREPSFLSDTNPLTGGTSD
jgi:hypothetical protein